MINGVTPAGPGSLTAEERAAIVLQDPTFMLLRGSRTFRASDKTGRAAELIAAAIREAEAAMREACARIADTTKSDDLSYWSEETYHMTSSELIAAAIRRRN